MTIRSRDDVPNALAKHGLPYDVAHTVAMYMFDRVEPGGFLFQVFSNSLTGAFAAADLSNRALMFEWASFVYNEMDTNVVGSRENVERHLRGE